MLPHALLFTGPDGVGKSYAAGWVAASFLCKDNGCGRCSVCKRAIDNVHPDVHVIRTEEGRRDITINQIRGLTGEVGKKPFEAAGKAVIVNEADRMNEESQNAFLKTLEEPPSGSLIVLVAASPARLLPTIHSRCQRFRFSRLSDEELEKFVASRPELDIGFPQHICQGRPGRLIKLCEIDISRARSILCDFVAAPSLPSPVKAAADLVQWASGSKKSKQDLREKLMLSLDLCSGMLRDIALLIEGVENPRFLNTDMEKRLKEVAGCYTLTSLFYALPHLFDAVNDINSYIDPALAVENTFRVIRDSRRRG